MLGLFSAHAILSAFLNGKIEKREIRETVKLRTSHNSDAGAQILATLCASCVCAETAIFSAFLYRETAKQEIRDIVKLRTSHNSDAGVQF